MLRTIRLSICIMSLLLAGWAGFERVAGHSQERTVGSPTPTPAASQDGFGNVQLLKGVRDLLPTMHFIRAALGVRCDYCHNTQTGKYYLDDKPAKRRAREMILMTSQLNDSAFGGKQVVTCNTCHRGSTKPVSVPQIATNFVNTTRVEAFEPPPPALPPTDLVLANYEAATHISAFRTARLRIELLRGKLLNGGTPAARMQARAERFETEALVDRDRGVTSLPLSSGPALSRVGSNGRRLWYVSQNGPQWIGGGDLEQLKRKIDPLRVLRMRPADYSSMTVVGTETIDAIETYAVDAVRPDGAVETLWFSKRDGLLVRRTYYHSTLLGPEPEQYDLSEYKRFGGLRLPTVINASYLDDQHLGVRKRLLDVKLNVDVSDSDFEPPTAADKKP